MAATAFRQLRIVKETDHERELGDSFDGVPPDGGTPRRRRRGGGPSNGVKLARGWLRDRASELQESLDLVSTCGASMARLSDELKIRTAARIGWPLTGEDFGDEDHLEAASAGFKSARARFTGWYLILPSFFWNHTRDLAANLMRSRLDSELIGAIMTEWHACAAATVPSDEILSRKPPKRAAPTMEAAERMVGRVTRLAALLRTAARPQKEVPDRWRGRPHDR